MTDIDNLFDDSKFGDDSEVKAQTVDWGKVGDYIKGTFIKARHGIKTQYGENSIYEFVAVDGQFHRITKKVVAAEPTKISKGEVWSVWGRNDLLNGQLNSLRPGQVVKVLFAEEKPSTYGNDSKIVKLYAPRNNDGSPVMNEEYLATLS